MAKNMVRAAI